MYDYPFHMLYLLYSFWMLSYRSYYTGYVDAAGEAVPKEQEGLAIRRLRYGLGIPFLLGIVLYLINPSWMMWSHLSDLPVLLRWIGMGMLLASLLIYRWTHVHLGKNFTDTVYVREKSGLITTGPFHWVRHPMYFSGVLAAVGTGLGLANWFLGIIGITLMMIIMHWRTPIEEKKLLSKHGDAYKEYMKNTGKFFPKIF